MQTRISDLDTIYISVGGKKVSLHDLIREERQDEIWRWFTKKVMDVIELKEDAPITAKHTLNMVKMLEFVGVPIYKSQGDDNMDDAFMVTNDEMSKKPKVEEGDMIKLSFLKKPYPLKFAEAKNGEGETIKSNALGLVNTGKNSYMVAVNGRLMQGELVNKNLV